MKRVDMPFRTKGTFGSLSPGINDVPGLEETSEKDIKNYNTRVGYLPKFIAKVIDSFVRFLYIVIDTGKRPKD